MALTTLAPAAAGAVTGRLATAAALIAAGVVLSPLAALVAMGAGTAPSWDHIAATLLGDYLGATLFAVGFGTLGATVVGAGLAWLIAMHRFPGRDVFAWALVLPLAMPGYVAAYAWADLAGPAGPIADALAAAFGADARALSPDIRSLPGLAFIFAATLFPYVYLAARAGFAAQSGCALDAARTLGAGPGRTALTIAAPLARPAIAAGAALAAMEMAADYGAADHLGVATLGVGVARAWLSFSDLASAARIALILMGAALVLLLVERMFRGADGATGRRWRAPRAAALAPGSGLAATLACLAALTAGFLAPVAHLAGLGLADGPPLRDLAGPLAATLGLGLVGTLAALVIAALALTGRRAGGLTAKIAGLTPAVGYAAPGAVLALGVLAAGTAGFGGGVLVGAGAIGLMAWAYAVRFGQAGLGPLEAGFARISPAVGPAARTLGAAPWRRFWTIEAPLAAPAAAAAALIAFVEVLKELPATKLLRPFGLDTLAVRAHAYASDERLAAAAWPALLIVAAGLAPTILLSRRLNAHGAER
jgi:iron(III) transport system permease protein